LGQSTSILEPRVLPLWRPVDKGMSSVVILKYINNSEAHTKSNIAKRSKGMARTRTPSNLGVSPTRGEETSSPQEVRNTKRLISPVFEPFGM